MVTTFVDLYPYVALQLAPKSTSDQNLARYFQIAARSFFIKTSAWRASISVNLTAGDTLAQLTLPDLPANDGDNTYGSIGKIISVKTNDGTDDLKTWDDKYYSLDGDGGLQWDIYRPNTGDVLIANVVIHPSLTCAVYPAGLIDKWQTAFVAGVLIELKQQQNFFDKVGLMKAMNDYAAECYRATKGPNLKSRSYFNRHPAFRPSSMTPGPFLDSGGPYRR